MSYKLLPLNSLNHQLLYCPPESDPQAQKFEKLPVRFGRKTLRPNVRVTVVNIAAKYKISFHTVRRVFCDIAIPITLLFCPSL